MSNWVYICITGIVFTSNYNRPKHKVGGINILRLQTSENFKQQSCTMTEEVKWLRTSRTSNRWGHLIYLSYKYHRLSLPLLIYNNFLFSVHNNFVCPLIVSHFIFVFIPFLFTEENIKIVSPASHFFNLMNQSEIKWGTSPLLVDPSSPVCYAQHIPHSDRPTGISPAASDGQSDSGDQSRAAAPRSSNIRICQNKRVIQYVEPEQLATT